MRPTGHASRRCLWPVILLLVACGGCSRPPWPSAGDAGGAIMARLETRAHAISTAVYRVRWRARGTRPHGEFILEIAYKRPGRFRVSATGPFGVPVFTAVIADEQFWFVDHQHGEYVADSIAHLDRYDLPLSSFFSGFWRDLFSGGWGGSGIVRKLIPSSRRNWYEAHSGNRQWSIRWNAGKNGPNRLDFTEITDTGNTVARVWFGHLSPEVPYWRMQRLELHGFEGGGRHDWRILSQTYNSDIPDRFFQPLKRP